MIHNVLDLEGIDIESVHRVSNKNNEINTPRTIVAKFCSYKDKQLQNKLNIDIKHRIKIF